MKRALPWLILLLPLVLLPYSASYLALRRSGFLLHRSGWSMDGAVDTLEADANDPAWLVGVYAPLSLVEVAWWSTRTPGEGQTLFAFGCGVAAAVVWRRRTSAWHSKLAVCVAVSALCVVPADTLVRYAIDPSTRWGPLPKDFTLPHDAAALISLVGLTFLVLVGVRFWDLESERREAAVQAPAPSVHAPSVRWSPVILGTVGEGPGPQDTQIVACTPTLPHQEAA